MKKLLILFLTIAFAACQDQGMNELETMPNEDLKSLILSENLAINNELVPSISREIKTGVKLESYQSVVKTSLMQYSANSELFSSLPTLMEKITKIQESSNSQARASFIDSNYDEVELSIISRIEAAFNFLPNEEMFLDEINSISLLIENEIEISERREILNTVLENSKYTALFWIDHKEQFVAEVNSAILIFSNGRVIGEWSWSWSDFGKEVTAGAAAGAVGGAIIGGSVSFGTLTVPGYVAGGIAGAAGGAVYYTVGQAWDWAFG